MFLWLQQTMFSSTHPTPCLGELSIASVDGTLSIGGRITNLVTLEPIAISADPAQTPLDARNDAHRYLDELLDHLETLSGRPPFPDL